MRRANPDGETVMSSSEALMHRLLALSKLRGVGPSTLEKLAQVPGLAEHSIADLAKLAPRVRKGLEAASAWSEAQRAAQNDLTQAAERQISILSILDADYPPLLRAAPDRPFFLYVKGQFHTNPVQSIAVIGTRHPTEHGRRICERLTSFFAAEGWSIISGLALGIDAIAHSSALAVQGHTVAVLAHGLHTIAPKQHEYLAQQILDQGGALVTEYGFGSEPVAHQFVKRDRVQAGLAQAVVMVQSDQEGGSMHASRAALEFGRHLAVPFPTQHDIELRERKIEANLLLASDDDVARAALLGCEQSDLSRLIVLRGREDYPQLVERLQ